MFYKPAISLISLPFPDKMAIPFAVLGSALDVSSADRRGLVLLCGDDSQNG
jgi:hypothetical protein